MRIVKVDDLAKWMLADVGAEAHVSASEITGNEWNFAVGKGASLFSRLSDFPTKLRSVTDRIYQGPITSADTVFLFKDFEPIRGRKFRVQSKALSQSVEIEQTLLKSVVRSGSVERYHAEATALVLFPYHVSNNQARLYTPQEMAAKFPMGWPISS